MKIHELGHIVLYVTDLNKLANFYRNTLGFPEIAREPGMAVFSSGSSHHELLLIEVGGVSRKRGIEPGLYHFGLKVGSSDEELREAYDGCVRNGVEVVGTADHTVTHSLYIRDPDGNEIEFYVDVTDEWKKNPKAVISPVKPLKL